MKISLRTFAGLALLAIAAVALATPDLLATGAALIAHAPFFHSPEGAVSLAMLGAMPTGSQGLPEVVRFKVKRGFRGRIDGQLGIANPGDIVDIDRALAMEMRAADRGNMVPGETPLLRQKNYLPERKRPENRPADPVAQLALMTKAFEGMTKAFEKLAAAGGGDKK